MKRIHVAAVAIVVAGLIFTPIIGSAQKLGIRNDAQFAEPTYQGKTLSYWLKVIHDRDDDQISMAFEALRSMGPQASPAVSELTRIVAAPFAAIRVGRDSDEEIACKLYDIEVRSEAIDVLASIGEAASPATMAVIQWALTIRVVPEEILTTNHDERFIELVTLDAEYRIRIIAAVMEFGEGADATLVQLLRSPDSEKRKIAALILGPGAVAFAADLMKSEDCVDKQLAIRIFGDMQPLIAKVYLAELKAMMVCDGN